MNLPEDRFTEQIFLFLNSTCPTKQILFAVKMVRSESLDVMMKRHTVFVAEIKKE